MPGAPAGSLTQVAVTTLLFGAYPAAFTALSGYCLHRVKCGPGRGFDKAVKYCFAYGVFFVPNAPMFLMYLIGESVFPFFFFAAVSALLFICLHCSPAQRRRRMYIPALLVFVGMVIPLSISGVESRSASQNREKNRETGAREFKKIMADLLRPERHVRPPAPRGNGVAAYKHVPMRFFDNNVVVPVPEGFSYIVHVPKFAAFTPELFNVLFFNQERQECFFVVLKEEYPLGFFFYGSGREEAAVEVPHFEERIFQHFKPSRITQDAWDVLHDILPESVERRYVRGGGRPGNRVVLYTDDMIVSALTAMTETHVDGGSVDSEFPLFFGDFFLGEKPFQCVAAAGGGQSPPDADMPLAWLDELRSANAGRTVGGGGQGEKHERDGRGEAEAEKWFEAFLLRNGSK